MVENKETKSCTIKISLKTKKKLDELKIHHRETYDDVINRIIEEIEKGVKKE